MLRWKYILKQCARLCSSLSLFLYQYSAIPWRHWPLMPCMLSNDWCTGMGTAEAMVTRLLQAVNQNRATLDRILAEQQQQVGSCTRIGSPQNNAYCKTWRSPLILSPHSWAWRVLHSPILFHIMTTQATEREYQEAQRRQFQEAVEADTRRVRQRSNAPVAWSYKITLSDLTHSNLLSLWTLSTMYRVGSGGGTAACGGRTGGGGGGHKAARSSAIVPTTGAQIGAITAIFFIP